MFKGNIQSGTVTGTGAALTVSCGFKPNRVEVINKQTLGSLVWTKEMGDGAAVKKVAAGTTTFITSNGITSFDGTAATLPQGFTIGTDATNGSGNDLYWTAWGQE